jgi:DNA-nicking Smr family endonuclease
MGEKNRNQDTDQDFENWNEDDVLPEYIEVTDVLDLHGFFPEQVPEIVEEFIKNALELQLYNLRIIHGKGRSKLKWTVYQVLKDHPDVAWIGDAPPEIGGWGATIVELKVER